MTINESTLTRVRYPPELLADSRFVASITAGTETSALLDLKNFAPRVLRLTDISVQQDAEVEIRLRCDPPKRLFIHAGAMFDELPNNFDLLAKKELRYALYASAAKTNYKTHFGLWVIEPTVADKLAMGIPLGAEEKQIDIELGISKSVQKGVHPLPLSYMLLREYETLHEETRGRVMDVTTSSLDVDTVTPNGGEFLVLSKISAAPGTTAQRVRIRIDRDEDIDYLELETYPLALTKEIDLWLPALREIKVRVIGAAAATSHAIRFTVLRCRLTNILRMRWGLMARADNEELWKKVKGGIV